MAAETRPGGRVGAAPLLLMALAAGCWLLSEALTGMESRYFDLLQRLQAGAASERIVVLKLDDEAGEWWNNPRLPELATALAAHRPLAVIPASPVPPAARLPDLDRLARLVELEQRNQRDASDPVSAQLDTIRNRIRSQDAAQATLASATRLILPISAGQARTAQDAATVAACAGPLLYTGEGDGPVTAALPRAALCRGVWLLGLDDSMPEADGIIRRARLTIAGSDGELPSATLAAAAGATASSLADRPGALARLLGSAKAGAGPSSIYQRFYADRRERPAFRLVTPEQLLGGQVQPGDLSQRIVIAGNVASAGADGHRTPVDPAMTPALLLATGLSNLLEQDYLRRPDWLRWLELALLLALALWAAMLSVQLPVWHGGALALALLPVLLGLQAWLALAGHVWMQLATPALFAPLAFGITLLLRRRLPRSGQRQPIEVRSGGADTDEQPVQELDLAFSVLRQQPPSEWTKKRLYNIAMEHGRRRDFARAERVLRHLASLDPGYRDVRYKLARLSGAQALPASEATAPRGAATKPPEGGDRLGRYRLESIIGRGAMATVYLGRDPTINRRVAIKTIPLAEEFSESDLANARAQFSREAESAGRLNHPDIIAIYDAGEDRNMAYLAMEYFEGKPLSHYAQPDRLLPPEVVLELMARAAEALNYAHGQKVVHRDIKPANLLYHAASDALKLTDFGIARLTDTSRTRSGIILGTPSYMSPEQLSATAVTGQSDLYSLGVTMYHLLTGAPPFQADSIPRLMEKIVQQRHRPVCEIRFDLPPCVDSVLDEAMAKQPADRFASGRAMALALRECCSRLATSSSRIGSA